MMILGIMIFCPWFRYLRCNDFLVHYTQSPYNICICVLGYALTESMFGKPSEKLLPHKIIYFFTNLSETNITIVPTDIPGKWITAKGIYFNYLKISKMNIWHSYKFWNMHSYMKYRPKHSMKNLDQVVTNEVFLSSNLVTTM